MRIGIVTFHRAFNCGAMLQAWALRRVLTGLGHDVTFPGCNHVGIMRRWPKRKFGILIAHPLTTCVNILRYAREVFLSIGSEDVKRLKYIDFRRRYLPERNLNVGQFKDNYDALVFGSDQIWNIKRSKNNLLQESSLFLASGVDDGILKVAYAASIGEEGTSEAENAEIKAAAARMDYLSMRERGACDSLYSKRGELAKWVLDPTLLLTMNDYVPLEYRKPPVRGRYVLLYVAQHKAEYAIRRAREAAEYLGCKCVILRAYYFSRHGMGKDEKTAFGPRDFVSLIKNATAVLSLSFHGTAFALIYHKPFVSLRDVVTEVESRQESLLRRLKCPERLVFPFTETKDWLPLLTIPPKEETYAEIDAWRDDSINWLKGKFQ